MREIGDRGVTVLKVEGVEKLLGTLGADLGERFAQRQRGTGVLGHRIRQHLGLGAVNRIDIRSRPNWFPSFRGLGGGTVRRRRCGVALRGLFGKNGDGSGGKGTHRP